ncbi:hypothetical protein AMK05_CH02758 [Rhizobium sp. N324]|nr:hypothetical protein AMK05_CH02758 [Rhizobium sp. N324]
MPGRRRHEDDAARTRDGAADAGGDFGHAGIEPHHHQRQGRRDLRQQVHLAGRERQGACRNRPGRRGGALVAQGEAVTIQGRFDDGFVHASYLVRQDGRTEALRLHKGPPHRRLEDFDHRP